MEEQNREESRLFIYSLTKQTYRPHSTKVVLHWCLIQPCVYNCIKRYDTALTVHQSTVRNEGGSEVGDGACLHQQLAGVWEGEEKNK